MKTTIVISICLAIAILVIPSCEKEPVRREPAKIELNKKAAEIIEADRAFGFELFREVLGLSDAENIMISPMSVSYALGMTYNGAAGATLEAFEKVLHFEGLTEQEINESYKDLMDQLLNLDSKVQFSLANSIWYRQGFEVLDEFINVNRNYFNAEVSEIDFSDPQTVEVINQWIEDKTNGKIKDMLDQIPSDAVMYLVNAIYFKATWLYEFEKKDTYQGTFNLGASGFLQADFMNVEGDFNYTANEDFTAVELPYGDSTFSMVVMLPAAGREVTDIVEKMNVEQWDTWFGSSWVTAVNVHLPKFKYEFKDLLNDPLINMGLGVAFSDAADFSRIRTSGGLLISRVIHQTFIDVNEEGTEAAAATIVEIRETSTGGGPVYFKADRPFLYVIKENSTGAIVFMGKVGKPEYRVGSSKSNATILFFPGNSCSQYWWPVPARKEPVHKGAEKDPP
jgi:serine protease inhibitor